MCARFSLTGPVENLRKLFGFAQRPNIGARYNIAPTQLVPAVRHCVDAEWEWTPLHWGLIPFWAKDPKIGSRMINARAETVADKPAFRRAFRKRRCLIVADGYYEWRKVGREKVPHYIRMQDDQPFAMAGLWERWHGGTEAQLDEPLESCTIITTTPTRSPEKLSKPTITLGVPAMDDFLVRAAVGGIGVAGVYGAGHFDGAMVSCPHR